MTKKKKVIERCRELGCMLLDSGDCLRVDPPSGKVIAGTGAHSINAYLDCYSRAEAYDLILNELSLGIEDCDDADCDSCVHEPMTFDELKTLYRGERLA